MDYINQSESATLIRKFGKRSFVDDDFWSFVNDRNGRGTVVRASILDRLRLAVQCLQLLPNAIENTLRAAPLITIIERSNTLIGNAFSGNRLKKRRGFWGMVKISGGRFDGNYGHKYRL